MHNLAVDKDVEGQLTQDPERAVLHPVERYRDLLWDVAGENAAEVHLTLIGGVPEGYSGGDELVYADSPDPVFQSTFGIGPGCTAFRYGQQETAVPPVRLRELAGDRSCSAAALRPRGGADTAGATGTASGADESGSASASSDETGSDGDTSGDGETGPSDLPPECDDCFGKVWECRDGLDNDEDGRVDMADPECVSPCDNDEAALSGGIPAHDFACALDCFVDANSGQGDDGCGWSLVCDPSAPAELGCPYDPPADVCQEPPSAQCKEVCLPSIPACSHCLLGCCVPTPAS